MKRIVDEQGRLFGRFNVVDILFVVVFVAFATAAFLQFMANDTPQGVRETTDINYEVNVHSIRGTVARLLHAGDRVFDQQYGNYLGIIKEVEITEAVAPEPLADGTVRISPIEDRYDVKLTIVAEGIASGGGFFTGVTPFGTFQIQTNAEVRMITKYNDFVGYIGTIYI